MKKILLVTIALAGAAAAGYLWRGKHERLPADPGTAAAAARGAAPSFRLPGAAGGTIDLASYAGKPVMFMFFTENCPYCRAAGPALEKLHKAYGPKGLTVLGVSIEGEKDAALNFARDMGVTFPLAYDGQEPYRAYRAHGVPYIYLIDAKGALYDVWEGYDDSQAPSMKAAVEKLLDGK
ncbi:MAG: peroxiredoxin family protein [Elusimicrobiales bacterium]